MTKRRLALVVLLVFSSLSLLHAEDFFFDSDGVKIHYIVEGQGEPVVLIHGFAASIQNNWAAPGLIKALAEKYQVVALDNRGHGQSDKPRGADAYGLKTNHDVIHVRGITAFVVAEDELRKNTVPVPSLIGEVDPIKDAVDRLDGVLANLKIVVIPKANHLTAFSNPMFAASLKAFLADHPRTRSTP